MIHLKISNFKFFSIMDIYEAALLGVTIACLIEEESEDKKKIKESLFSERRKRKRRSAFCY